MLNTLFILLLSLPAWSQVSIDQILYDDSVEDVNIALENSEGAKCSGLKLVISCGNKVCEKNLGENEKTCAPDCIASPIKSYNKQTICQNIKSVKVPTTKLEVQDIIKEAIAKNYKVKAVGALHSASETICTEGVIIPMSKFNQVIGITEVNGTKVVEAQGGITVYNLSEWLYDQGFSLAGLPHMGFRDVTIAGSMATGSHGSTTMHSGVISNIVEAIEFIDGQGQIRYLERQKSDPTQFKAMAANLGLLGVVTSVKLAIQPKFNLDVAVTYHDESILFEKGIHSPVKDCDYGQLNWFPGARKFVKTCGKKSSLPVNLNAHNELLKPKIPAYIVNPFKQVLQLGACHNTIMCLVEKVRYFQFKVQPPLVDEKGKNQHQIVGPSHQMVSSHLTSQQEGFFQMDWEIAVPASKANQALVAIRKLLDNNKTCLPLVGIFVRYAPSEDRSLLAHTKSDGVNWIEGEPAVFFEMPVYLPVGLGDKGMKAYEKPFEDFATMLIKDFAGRPHWGKNREWTYSLAKSVGAYGKGIEEFQRAINEFDPRGVFSNKISDILGLKYKKKKSSLK